MAQTLIGLAGNPNCGKTTLFNELTGSNGYVGNWPGVTVEKKQADWRADRSVTFVDLPGIYSLSPYTPEEVVTRDYLVQERPHAIINLVDVTNLERNLYLTTQVLEAGLPAVVGLNMCDLLRERGDVVNVKALSAHLGVPVIEVSALRSTNIDELVRAAVETGKTGTPAAGARCFTPEVEEALGKIGVIAAHACEPALLRWYSVKLFERDVEAVRPLALPANELAQIEDIIAAVEKDRDDDSESIITTDRYDWISTIMEECVTKAPRRLSTSEKIDRVVTNRILGLPIFVAVMVLVYYIAISTIGKAGTDWVNDNLFSDGFFINSAGQASYDEANEAFEEGHYADQIDAYLAAANEAGIDTESATEAVAALGEDPANEEALATLTAFSAEARDANVVATNVPVHDSDGNFLDTEGEVITHLTAEGEPVLAEGQELDVIERVDNDAFDQAIEATAEKPDPAAFEGFVPSIPTAATAALESAGASPLVISLVVDGVIGGVGAVLGFIPQMLVLFALLCFLEDCGYMSRVAFVMDRVFRRFGLSGKSFIPLLVSTGCGVPGVMATKTIENEKDRRMTAMLTTMMPCGAKMPIISLVMGVLAGGDDAWWVAPMFYFLGVLSIVLAAVMLKKTRMFAGDPTPFVMELPDYHLPALRSWALHVWERISAYAKKAGTIIFAAAVGIWFLSNFGFAGWEGGSGAFGYLPELEGAPEEFMDFSLLASIGGILGIIFAPLGADTWQATAASISALIAKENLVSTFGVIYGLGDVSEHSVGLWQGFAGSFTDAQGVFRAGAMCAFVAFNMLDAPCFAAIGTIRRQMDSAKWFWFAIIFQCVFAWVVGLIINQLWNLIVLGEFGVWTAVALALIALMLFQLFRPTPKFESGEERIASSLTGEAVSK